MLKYLYLMLFLLGVAVASDELVYKTYYLGLHPEAKMKILKDFLSEQGKMFKLPNGSVFVKDEARVLEEIEKFLKEDHAVLVPQIKVSFQNLNTLEDKTSATDIDFKYSKNRGGSISIKGGVKERYAQKDQLSHISTLSGQSASLAIYRTEEQLLSYRSRYLKAYVKSRIKDGVVLWVKPTMHGKRVMVHLKTVYWAIVKGKRKQFKTGEIDTKVFVPLGLWQSVGGLSESEVSHERRNFFLSRKNQKRDEVVDLRLKADVVKVQTTK